MCLSTVYLNAGSGNKEIMKDVAQVKAEGNGYWLINLFGEKEFVKGVIESMDLMDNLIVVHSGEASALNP